MRKKKKSTINHTRKKLKLNKKRLAIFITLTLFFCIFAIGAGVVVASVSGVPAFNPKNLDNYSSTLLLDKDGKVFDRVHGAENRIPITIDKIPKNVQNAFIAIEDVRFYEHHGVSLRDIFRAIYIDITKQKKEQGASTITQQLAKLTFLTPDKTPKRKIQEMYLALKIERQYTKKEILEMYLNKIYFSHGAYGIQAAAQTYFSKDVQNLTVAEAATLAAIPKGPSIYDPKSNPKNAKARRNLVLSNMEKYSFISKEEATKDEAEEIKLNYNENNKLIYNHPYFVEYVIDQLKSKGYSDETIYTGGLKVYTTMDPKIQTTAEDVLKDPANFKGIEAKPTDSGLQPQASAVVSDPHTGYLKALVGGRDFLTKRQLNRVNIGKQPGSSIKPLLDYGPAIEKGDSPATPVDDSPLHYPNAVNGKDWDPKNDGNEGFSGITTYRSALAFSRNIPAIEVLQKTGLTEAIKFTKKLGLTTIDEKKGLSNALGTSEVTPIQVAGAYGAFANNGIYIEPTAILKIVSENNKTDEIKQEKHVAMKETTAYIITSMLQSVVSNGTGTAAQLPNWQVAGKTGTTDEGKNLWFDGYTTSYLGVVWIGHDKPQRMGDYAYAGTYAAPIWKKIMLKAHEGVQPTNFKEPNGIITATVDGKSGLLPGPNCPPGDIVTDIFAKNTVPTKICDAHVVLEVCTESNQLATKFCPTKAFKTFLKKIDVANRPASVDPEPDPPTVYCTLHNESS